MKTVVSIAMALVLVFGFAVVAAGCGGAPSSDTGAQKPDTTAPTAPPEPSAEKADDVAPPAEGTTTPDSTAPADSSEGMNEQPAAQGDSSAAAEGSGSEASADSGKALTDEFDDFDYSAGGGAASKRR